MPELRYLARGSSARDTILKTLKPPGAAGGCFSETAEMAFTAWDMLFKGDAEGARSLAQQALVIDGRSADALSLLAEIAMQSGDLEKAGEYLLKAFEGREETNPPGPSDPDASARFMQQAMAFFYTIESMAALCIEMGNYEKATELLKVFPDKVKPLLPWAACQLVRLYAMTGKRDEALACFRPGIGLRPPGSDYDVALCHIMKGDAPRAIRFLQEGFFESPCIALEILGEPAPAEMTADRQDEFLEQARRYLSQMRGIWEETPGAVDFLRALWNHPDVRVETIEYSRLANQPLVSSKGAVDPDTLESLSKLVSSRRLKKTSHKIARDIPPILPDTTQNPN